MTTTFVIYIARQRLDNHLAKKKIVCHAFVDLQKGV